MRKLGPMAIVTLLCCFLLSGCGFIHLKKDLPIEKEVTGTQQDLGCVTLFEHRDFKGKSKKFCASHQFVGDDFNDISSSIKIDCDIQSVNIFEHIDYGGKKLTYSGCQEIDFVGSDFNDITSSIQIVYHPK